MGVAVSFVGLWDDVTDAESVMVELESSVGDAFVGLGDVDHVFEAGVLTEGEVVVDGVTSLVGLKNCVTEMENDFESDCDCEVD